MMSELLNAGHRILLTDIESGELDRPRPRTEAQLESAVRCVRQGDSLLGEHGGMPKGVAPQPFRLGRPPRGNSHCLPNTFVGQPRRLKMIDECHSVEATGLGMAGPVCAVCGCDP